MNSLVFQVLAYGVLAVLAIAALVLGLTRKSATGQFALGASVSMVIGLLLGAAAIFGVTLMVQQDTKPPLAPGEGSSILNRVEYGDRS